MIVKALCGKLTLAGFFICILFAAIQFALRSRPKTPDPAQHEQWLSDHAPAANQLDAAQLVRDRWHFSGALGILDISFRPDGSLSMTGNERNLTGKWFIENQTLHISIPEAETSLQGFFVDDPNKLQGVSTRRSETAKWNAKRIKTAVNTDTIKSYEDFRRLLREPEHRLFGNPIKFEDPWVDIDEFNFDEGPPFRKWSINFERSDWPKSASYGGTAEFSLTNIVEIWSGT